MRYTKLAPNAFAQLLMNSGLLMSDFNPATGEYNENKILGVTSGGINFEANPEFVDLGEDIDNCQKGTKELKRILGYEVKISGTFTAINQTLAKLLMAAADVDPTDITKIIPRMDLVIDDDFMDMWLVGNYSDKTGPTNGGYLAIKMLNALSTGGFKIQTTDREKGKFAFEFTGHYSYNNPDVVPYEVYIKAGTAEPTN